MSFLIHDPTGKLAKVECKVEQKLEFLENKRVGFIFNQHASAGAFWKRLEEEVEKKFAPALLKRIYKENTWAPAPKKKVEELAQEIDYALVGVGA